MFELSVACKYLIPRRQQLSVSIISLVSTLVIALVVWLIVVFFSVKDGLENSWVDKIIALTAPVRVTPTEKYYNSYYYLIDSLSGASDYTTKSIGEKLIAFHTDPYDIENDEELPARWPAPDRHEQGELKDLAKEVFKAATAISGLKELKVTDYETTFANLHLRLLRTLTNQSQPSQQFIDHGAYIGSFDSDTPSIAKALFPITAADINNLLHMQAISADNLKEDSPEAIHHVDQASLQKRLQLFFDAIEVKSLKTPSQGWRIPLTVFPETTQLVACALFRGETLIRILIPKKAKDLQELIQKHQSDDIKGLAAQIEIKQGNFSLIIDGQTPNSFSMWTSLILEPEAIFSAKIIERSLSDITKINEIHFDITGEIQGVPVSGEIPLGKLEINEASIRKSVETVPFAYLAENQTGIVLPKNSPLGDPVLLPRNFKEGGALIGDQGYLSYLSPTPSTIQEQRIPIFVAGFYDPGIMSIGGKYILANKELTALIRASYNQNDTIAGNGFNIRFSDPLEAPRVKAELQEAFEKLGIAPYWHIETYQEYEFTKDLIQQLHSEKNMFSLISLIIIIVACSNIISMLIILVNDKKLEIGILRSMGATSASIAAIFGFCGMVMGTLGSFIGIIAAILTLRNINPLIEYISYMQGYDLFNPVFYGHTLPSELSVEALTFVIITTSFISLLAGIVPAVKASLLRPSAILRAE